MTAVFIDNNAPSGLQLLKEIKKHPRVAWIMDDLDNTPLPLPEEELVSLETFKKHFEKRIFERLGLTVSL
jgi:hypothetical protein